MTYMDDESSSKWEKLLDIMFFLVMLAIVEVIIFFRDLKKKTSKSIPKQ